jgi:hypothetical protein
MKSVESTVTRKGSPARYDAAAYERTPFGRRRISKVPKPIGKILSVLGILGLYILRRFRRAKVR